VSNQKAKVYFNRRERRLAFWQSHRLITWITRIVPIALILIGQTIYVLDGVSIFGPDPADSSRVRIQLHWVAVFGVVLGILALATGAWSKPLRSPGERFGVIVSRVSTIRDEIEAALKELDALQKTANQVEQRARDNQMLSGLTSEQFNAWRRDLKRRDRITFVEQALFTVAGAILGFWLTHYMQ
jgi:hypothetical protein